MQALNVVVDDQLDDLFPSKVASAPLPVGADGIGAAPGATGPGGEPAPGGDSRNEELYRSISRAVTRPVLTTTHYSVARHQAPGGQD